MATARAGLDVCGTSIGVVVPLDDGNTVGAKAPTGIGSPSRGRVYVLRLAGDGAAT